MSEYADSLLKLAYDNYLKTSSKNFQFVPPNSEHFVLSLNATEDLQENGYINMLSDILQSDSFILVEQTRITDACLFWFELTGKGLDYCRRKFKF